MVRYLETHDYNRGLSEAAFRYCRCRHCGLVSLENVPQDLGPYYSSGYHSVPRTLQDLERGAEHERYKIDLVQQFARKGRILEIGPSWGAFCLLAQRAAFEVEAIEMDDRCCEFLRSALGIRAMHTSDPTAALSDASRHDVIALWHVLEHMREPWPLLQAAARNLAPSGLLVIATPNPLALQFRVFGRYWTHVDAPRHVHLIPSLALCKFAETLGLEAVLVTTKDAGSIGWNEFGWRFSLANLVRAAFLKRGLRFAGRFVSRAMSWLESSEGRGSAYTAVFRKRNTASG